MDTPMSDRYAEMAHKSALEAEAAARRGELAANADEPRQAKRARREASDWYDLTLRDAMRANGAYSAEIKELDAKHGRAEDALTRALKAKDAAAETYRQLKVGTPE